HTTLFRSSAHNLKLTEEQFGVRLNNSRIVINPIKIKREVIPYPPTKQGFRLACIGRYFLIDKGQDILIKILSQEKWRERSIHVSFYGDGVDLINIQELIDLLEVANITIEKKNESIEDLWKSYHALIVPSRS